MCEFANVQITELYPCKNNKLIPMEVLAEDVIRE